MKSWLGRVWAWLGEVPTFWGFLTLLMACFGLPLGLGFTTEDGIRYAGMLLQLVGVGVVAYTLRGRGKLFGRLPVMRYAIQWIRRAPVPRPRHQVLEVTGVASTNAFGSAELTVWRGPLLDQPLDAQLAAIRENLETLRGQFDSLAQRQGVQIAEVRQAIASERAERSQQVQAARRTLEGVAAESLYLEAAGLVALVIGIIAATIPVELAALLTRSMA